MRGKGYGIRWVCGDWREACGFGLLIRFSFQLMVVDSAKDCANYRLKIPKISTISLVLTNNIYKIIRYSPIV